MRGTYGNKMECQTEQAVSGLLTVYLYIVYRFRQSTACRYIAPKRILSSRVCVRIYFFDMTVVQIRVDLRRRDIRMPQHLLHAP